MLDLIKYRLKIVFTNKESLFWSIMFPLILSTLFTFAFSNITKGEKFKTIEAGILMNENIEKDVSFNSFINSIDSVSFTKYDDEKTIKEDLNKGNIKGYFIKNNNYELVVKGNGLSQTILQYMLTNYLQTNKLINNIYKETNNYDSNVLLIRDDHIVEADNKKNDLMVSYIYTLIAMSALFAAYSALYALTTTEANLSKVGARFNIIPTHKMKLLLVNLLCGTLFSMVGMTILFIYILFILKIDLGNNALYSYFVSLIGILSGISLGLFISSAFKMSESAKGGLITALVMTMSGLSGMFHSSIKMYIDTNLPIINRFNPASIVTDSLNFLYRYNELYWPLIFRLIAISMVLLIVSYIFIRRKKYDSI